MTYRAALVEDEERSLSRLRRILGSFSDEVEVVGEAMDGPAAVTLIRDTDPDLVFLDIDLPGLNGFEVLERLERQPAVIFTTAYDEHALKAFKAHTVDYLLKPIDPESLGRALKKLRAMGFDRARFSDALNLLLKQSEPRYPERIPCKVGDRTTLVRTGEILYFQADHRYTAVRTATREFLLDTPLVKLEREMNPRDFVRIHRGTLVNLAWVAEIRRGYDKKLRVLLKDADATELPVSRGYADNLNHV